MNTTRNFSISVGGDLAGRFWELLKSDYDDLGCYRDEELLSFRSSQDKDGYSMTLNLYAPPERDRPPLVQLVIWHKGHRILADTVTVGVVCEFDYPDVYGESFHLDVVIATKAMAESVIRKLKSLAE